MLQLTNTWQDFTHLFFPALCAGCGTDAVGTAAPLCISCIKELPLTNFHLHAGNPVEKDFWGRTAIHSATALCHFTTGSLIQQLLHQLKYKGHQELGHFLGKLMGASLQQSDRFAGIDLLLPLPLFASRLRKRGYNQSALLCNGMASVLSLPVLEDVLTRLSATDTQTQKNRIQRWKNMEGRFSVLDPAALAGKHVLLVDDVITTGATLEACGQALLKVEGVQLSIAALAYTV
ncbi:MAG TPA: phosphoribosyltransferase family protein [Chitinophagaceae bacterium]|nr:phosphoribosyltransferase family protein [Chitinophagaceae bacterium]